MLRHQICRAIADAGGTPFYVGGCVRDQLLGMDPKNVKDFDVEVFDIKLTTLKNVLSNFGVVNEVGTSFGVLKVRAFGGKEEIDFSTPRRENKTGRGHRGFQAEYDPTMSLVEAAQRRDFTINAIYQDAVTGELYDPWGGIQDLKERRLRHVGPQFAEDPLRPLRGFQFASRFCLNRLDYNTAAICNNLWPEYYSLPTERISEEWRKWAQKCVRPSYGLHFLRRTSWLPEAMIDLIDVPQDPKWHPEGDVYAHTCYVCDAMADVCYRENITGEDKEVLMFAALTHDFGKPFTTVFNGEPPRWRSPGHAEAGVPIARTFLKSIGIYERVIERVLPLVQEHMYVTWTEQSRRTVRRLKLRLGKSTLEELLLLIEADLSGRPPYPRSRCDNYSEIQALASELPLKIEPILTGRHILSFGVRDGKEIGRIKKEAFEEQLRETFEDESGALQWLENRINLSRP